uniref:NADP-dependent oxidoreductase domain-containing protein n=1 Tax=Chromera velia CCMP2878 TaxID=1169474 RepID=A0A0G4FTZ5_9ALVE|mmetsp:Transcript_3164/g.6568  ORF Transcript_3164/g.6568 Transcript_3164/m.6568 type:complete len:434 (+) Transcript_3164:153-1454(+)|eukprot:Cvel_18652.t1-p1 / transcript=Cvel_18652.t1 / gene=Cvel_18652 / organism=Chromera_velia_CCMP2878 / gene_product=Uncharacterized oxidoreductase YccK, putative / transcript_product=Uncharacterized oxidoreductase YccK, putative / location=Cvel_scaffold1558:31280-37537(+) / protein_length=433 / sequence_SO=supercontig / SO=protein_coding / is_pseudo=false
MWSRYTSARGLFSAWILMLVALPLHPSAFVLKMQEGRSHDNFRSRGQGDASVTSRRESLAEAARTAAGVSLSLGVLSQPRGGVMGPEPAQADAGNYVLPSKIETFSLGSLPSVPRVVNGLWQVSGAHGPIDPQRAVEDMKSYEIAGLRAWDMADIYGPAELIYGKHLREYRDLPEAVQKPLGFTKFVPRPSDMSEPIVRDAIDRSLKRIGADSLDLLQFHWWEYGDNRYKQGLDNLAKLRDSGEKKIKELAVTNFDTEHVKEANERVRIVSNQVQYSLIDSRPSVKLSEYCQEKGIKLLAYGTLLGGLLSEKFLGKLEPSDMDLNTASLQKYKQMIDAWGGWGLFQQLLGTLNDIARQKKTSIPAVATRMVLDKPAVGAVILGARLGVANHVKSNVEAFKVKIGDGERKEVDKVLRKSRDLFALIGDTGDEYR